MTMRCSSSCKMLSLIFSGFASGCVSGGMEISITSFSLSSCFGFVGFPFKVMCPSLISDWSLDLDRSGSFSVRKRSILRLLRSALSTVNCMYFLGRKIALMYSLCNEGITSFCGILKE